MAPHTRARTELDGTSPLTSGLNVPATPVSMNPPVSPATPQGGTTNTTAPTHHVPYGYYPTHTSSAVSITACRLSKTDLDKIELLDRVKNNWTSWSELMLEIFHMNLLEGYTTGTVARPDAAREPVAARNWDLNNAGIIAALRNRVSPDDKRVLDGITNARVAWNALRSRHQKLGPIAQILKIQELLNVRYSRDTNLAETSHRLTEGIRAIFDMGIPTQQVFLSIIMLNALTGDMSHVRDHVASSLAASTSSNPFTPDDIRVRLDMEQQLIDADKHRASTDVALIAQGGRTKNCLTCRGPPHKGNCCSHCSKRGHVLSECFAEGGAAYGRRDEILAAKRAARDKRDAPNSKPPSSSSKPTSNRRTDSSGRAYLLDSVTGEAFYIATPTQPPAPPSEEFAGLAHDVITPAFIQDLSEADMAEWDALFLDWENLQTTVDWNTNSRDVEFAGIANDALHQPKYTPVNLETTPFYLDSGASVHISHEVSDFFELNHLPPRPVRGIGGSHINAVGIGSIRLRIGRGLHITLHNVLFVPSAAVRLVSVSSLCSAGHYTARFDASSCSVVTTSGARVLTGTLTSRRLYRVSG
ncbi:hypothetical protein DEU56DRAFT_918731 [Suillus clintonianus]|uniref:uncharacterized protein n=1 Tax=Suillus clintonianus TaxID=1904413 RepID=UPI001B8701A8|nr:uncharacterized protein DEU56DRAFT_918731 [Suillus clintonianus]KAG2118633.1 hypothetical protein DEU56DRAFT_918731 [Suillus clintonianus]